jgi:hypothetical protein
MFLLGSGVVTFATATLVVGISTTNRATAIIRDFGGAVVASIDASTLPALPPGALAEFKLSWDAGLGLVAMSVNGVAVPPGDFITDPGGTPWVPGVPTVAVLDKGSLSQPITLSQISADYLL